MSNDNGVPLWQVFLGVLCTGFFLLAIAASVTVDDDRVPLKALDDAGYSRAKILTREIAFGYEGCGQGDHSVFSAKAMNPAGKEVTVLACCGGPWSFKTCTIRSKSRCSSGSSRWTCTTSRT